MKFVTRCIVEDGSNQRRGHIFDMILHVGCKAIERSRSQRHDNFCDPVALMR